MAYIALTQNLSRRIAEGGGKEGSKEGNKENIGGGAELNQQLGKRNW